MPLRIKRGKKGKILRIGLQGRRIRLSRTGGFSVRHQTKIRGISVTGNSSKGLRVSRRLARGTQVAMQNGRPIIRGRYKAGPSNVNLSRSGLSGSVTNQVGALNITHPRRSSVSIAGMQFRGGAAISIHLIYIVLYGPIKFIRLCARKISNLGDR